MKIICKKYLQNCQIYDRLDPIISETKSDRDKLIFSTEKGSQPDHVRHKIVTQ